MSNFIFGQRAVWCAICHKAPGVCRCEPLYPLMARLTFSDQRALLIAARVGVVVHQGTRYALTWDEGES